MSNRRQQSFQFTLIEFVLFISFCFLLVTAISIQDLQDLLKKSGNVVEISEKYDAMDASVKDLSEYLVVQSASEKFSSQEYLEKLNELMESSIDVEDDWQVIQAAAELAQKNHLTSSQVRELEKLLDNMESDVGKQFLAMQAEISQLKGERDNVRKQVQYLQKRKGLDKPPCLLDDNSEIRYLAGVELRNDGFWLYDVSSEAKDRFAITGGIFDENSFGRMARSVLLDSKRQASECRYYVKVRVRTTSDFPVDAYRQMMSLVDNNFYKRVDS